MKAQFERILSLRGRKRLEYLLDYYKGPLFALCLILVITVSTLSRAGRPQPVLYGAFVNVSLSEGLTRTLTESALPSGQPFCLYRNLFLRQDADSAEHAYTYASRMKILAALNAERLDVIFMDREAFDAFSQNGYLLDLDSFLTQSAPDLDLLSPFLVSNTQILEDNSVELLLGNEKDYRAVTKDFRQGICLSDLFPLESLSLSGELYLGISANSPRLDAVSAYLRSLCQDPSKEEILLP